jgi:hypothetical protein
MTNSLKEMARKEHYGLSYDQFLRGVCNGCKNPCYVGEERCEKLDRKRQEYGF